MILAVVFGALTGLVGVVPLLVSRHLAIRGNRKQRESSITIGLVCVLVSLILMGAALVVVSQLAQDVFLPFAVSVLATFFVGSIVLMIIGFRQ
ncbi:MAG: hypothetical protein LBG97_03730 [Coriobacteriales bacterium]|jgi:drug/metabolite transporter (DMT)-like permease|nr:hypothetical protein [Coriobacteriales bacterium]